MKIPDFAKRSRYWEDNITQFNCPRNEPSQERLKWEILTPTPGFKITEKSDRWAMEKSNPDIKLPS